MFEVTDRPLVPLAMRAAWEGRGVCTGSPPRPSTSLARSTSRSPHPPVMQRARARRGIRCHGTDMGAESDPHPNHGIRFSGLAEGRYKMRAFFLAPLLIVILAATPARADHDSALAMGVAIGIIAGVALADRHDPAAHVHARPHRHAHVHRHAHRHRSHVHRHRGHGKRGHVHRHAHGHGHSQTYIPVQRPRYWHDPFDWYRPGPHFEPVCCPGRP